jgi:hypothetical protein
MSTNNSIFCPACQQRTAVDNLTTINDKGWQWSIGQCNNCEQHFLVKRDGVKTIVELWPKALPRPVNEAIPEAIRSDIEEALRCMTVESYRAAAAMARRAMQSICLDQKAPKKMTIKKKDGSEKTVTANLINQIDWLEEQRIITPSLRNWAHEVRAVGNNGAHPADAEDSEAVSPQDADEAIELVEAFCAALYITPSLYEKRQAAKATEQAETTN